MTVLLALGLMGLAGALIKGDLATAPWSGEGLAGQIWVWRKRWPDKVIGRLALFSLSTPAIALLWLTGPGIVFPLTSRRRRLARLTHCAACGHPMGPSPGRACPECGHSWLPVPRPSHSAAGPG